MIKGRKVNPFGRPEATIEFQGYLQSFTGKIRIMKRRDFSLRVAGVGLVGSWVGESLASDLFQTFEQTRGPFYPIP